MTYELLLFDLAVRLFCRLKKKFTLSSQQIPRSVEVQSVNSANVNNSIYANELHDGPF